jgi:endonuclease YncB( thermonuclease family)
MTKRQDLCLQRRPRPEQSDHRQPDQAANISHQPRASPNSTSLASRIEFPTMTMVVDGRALLVQFRQCLKQTENRLIDIEARCPRRGVNKPVTQRKFTEKAIE